jgi:hypothetical protein
MTHLFVGDLHLTDNSRDAYRFKIFDWIKKQQVKHNVKATFLAGDLTDAKDRHSSVTVNGVCNGLTKLVPPVYICCGNHDYRDRRSPYFDFLNHIHGVTFCTTPTVALGVAVIPHSRTQAAFCDHVAEVREKVIDTFLVHQTFDGAIAETGARLTGLLASPIEVLKPKGGILAGDVHRPQRQGIVTYIGCPYHVRFGDNYEPRVLLVSKGGRRDLSFNAPRKFSLTITDPKDLYRNECLYVGDYIKITLSLTRDELVNWKSNKAEALSICKELGLEVFGIKFEIVGRQIENKAKVLPTHNPLMILDNFCKNEKVPATIKEVGIKILGK